DGQKIVLTLAPPAGAPDPGEMYFFAYAERQIEASAPQSLARTASGAYRLTLPVAYRLGGGFTKVDGVVTSSNGFANGNGFARAVAVDVPLAGAIVAGPKPAFDDGAINAAAAVGPASSLTFGAAVLL